MTKCPRCGAAEPHTHSECLANILIETRESLRRYQDLLEELMHGLQKIEDAAHTLRKIGEQKL